MIITLCKGIGAVAVVVGGAFLLEWLHRSRRKCSQCGAAFHLARWAGRPDVCESCGARLGLTRAGAEEWSSYELYFFTSLALFLGYVAFLGAVMVFLAVFVGGLLTAFLLPAWLAYPISILIALAYGFRPRALVRNIRALAVAARCLARWPRALDLSAARRAARASGRLVSDGRVAVWTDGGEEVAASLLCSWEEIGRKYEEMTGLSISSARGVRVLCFETEQAWQEYMRPLYGHDDFRGCYVHEFGRRIVMCREAADLFPSTAQSVFAHEMTHCLLRGSVTWTLPPWLGEGIALCVAHNVAGSLAAPHASFRMFRACKARGALFGAREMFAMKYSQLKPPADDRNSVQKNASRAAFYGQSGGIVRFLTECHPDAFRRFLSELTSSRDTARLFPSCLGMSADDVVRRWMERMEGATLPPHVAPPDDAKLRIEREIVEPLLRGDCDRDRRAMLVRYLGSTGYPWRADVLIGLLDDQDASVREWALLALQGMSGDLRDNSQQTWCEWLDSLPPEVTGRTEQLESRRTGA